MNTFVKVMHINTCNYAACASVPTLGIEMPYEVVKENCLAVACPKAAAMLSDKDKRLALEATTGSCRKATFVCPDCGQEFEAEIYSVVRSVKRRFSNAMFASKNLKPKFVMLFVL